MENGLSLERGISMMHTISFTLVQEYQNLILAEN